MTNQQLLRRMSEDMQMRGMAEGTQALYLRRAEKFLAYCGKSAHDLDERDARQYLLHLLREEKLSNGSVNTFNEAIRFLFAVTMNRTMNYLQMPRFKKRRTLPELLSREEAIGIIAGCVNLKHKCWLLLAYGSGLRVSEIAALRVRDIDSRTMRVFVQDGKGGKDRYTLLSSEALSTLRDYWREYHPARGGWLFPGATDPSDHITSDAIGKAFIRYRRKQGIEKDVSIHSLRHAFATHLLEDGATILQIKELLGHASLNSTWVYLHLANITADLVSPADRRCGDGR
jgi:site-specific recombinase XerD